MISDRILAILALAAVASFLGILLYFVRRLDLGIVLVAVTIMIAVDFYRQLRRARPDARPGIPPAQHLAPAPAASPLHRLNKGLAHAVCFGLVCPVRA